PAICESRGGAERPLLATAADPDRKVCLDRFREVRCVRQREVLAFEVGVLAIEEKPQRLGVFPELILPHAGARERNAVRPVLGLMPSSAKPARDPPLRQKIYRGDRFREDNGMAV